jgi:Tol biopolymer transport system component
MTRTLAPGTCLGPYEVLALLGAGGMGEVYRGRDTRLRRDVAIKVLPASVAGDQERLRRFEQESRAAGLLNHPNILTVHDVGTHDGLPFIVSELVEGIDLRTALAQGPLPVKTAVDYGAQLARGLSAAHARGIVHRDLKPENVRVSHDGQVKILDFGLAKLLQPAVPAAGASETVTMHQTGAGAILGTPGYMAPEQALGLDADWRVDIFALGVILYELLSGHSPFRKDSPAESVGASVTADPPELGTEGRLVPPAIARLVARCMAKNPARRFQSADDLAFALEILDIGESRWTAAPGAVTAAPSRGLSVRRWLLSTGGVAVVGVALMAALGIPDGILSRGDLEPARPAVRFAPDAPPQTRVAEVSLSPDGSRVALATVGPGGRGGLWVRSLDTLEARQLTGTEDATGIFWSPDGASLAFFAQRKLRRLDLATGTVTSVCDSPDVVSSGAWGTNQTILFAPRYFDGLFRVPASGGTPQRITRPDRTHREVAHLGPAFLPDGRHFLFLALDDQGEHWLWVGSTDGAPASRLVRSESVGLYSAGHLLYVRENTLFAQPLDATTRTLSAARRPVVTGLPGNIAGFTGMSASRNGVLAYEARPDPVFGPLRWLSRDGRPLGEASPGGFFAARLSPDGERAAGIISDPRFGSGEIWLRSFADGASQRFTFNPWNDNFPVWSPDGRRLVFRSDRSGVFDLFEKPADGSQPEAALLATDTDKLPTDWSPDGRFLLYESLEHETRTDIWVLAMTGQRTPLPFVRTAAGEGGAVFSPDGRWVAYESDASGRPEVYVTAFPLAGAQWQISTGGGSDPRWPRNGREIIFRGTNRALWSVPVTPGATFHHGRPTELFSMTALDDAVSVSSGLYDVSADARRVLVGVITGSAARGPFDVIVNWPVLLRR